LLFAAQEPSASVPAPFTAARFREHVAYLASDELEGRDVGSAGSAKAIAYLIRHFKECGAVGLGPGGEWLQTFPYLSVAMVRPGSNLEMINGPTFTFGRDFRPSPRSPSGAWEGELVFAGYGVSVAKVGYDDFANVDLHKKVAVILGEVGKPLVDAGAPADLVARWRECQRRGAIGVIAIYSKLTDAAGLRVLGEFSTEGIPCVHMTREAAAKLFPDADSLAAPEAALSGTGNLEPRSRALVGKLRLTIQVQRMIKSGQNVLAIVPGKGELAREAVLVSAHHDHLGIDAARLKAGKDGIFNGADDNASGCAALLLLAEALHGERDRLAPSCRTVIFASFDAEERGLVGSRYYVNHHLWPLPRTAANLNFDMVGRLNRGKLLALDGETSAFLAQRLTQLAPGCGLRVETRLNGLRRSDNANFLDREIPAVHFSTGIQADYHQVTDEIARIDSEGGARVAWLVYRLLREAMETPGRLRYQAPSPAFDLGGIIQVVLKLGIIPEENAQSGKYLHIRLVVPFGIAWKYGLKSGDDVSGVNGHEFDRIEEAAVLFGQLRLDDGVRFTVQRNGKKLEIKIPAEAVKDFSGPRVRPAGKDRFDVLFRYKPPGKVSSVAVAGTFNNWDTKAQPLTGPDKDGLFSARVVLARAFMSTSSWWMARAGWPIR
jgi:Zn-dependent M28 family amino/carboxypeptidase